MTEFPPFPTLIQKDGQRETCPVVQLGEVVPFLLDANSLHLRTQQVWRGGEGAREGRDNGGGRGKDRREDGIREGGGRGKDGIREGGEGRRKGGERPAF